MADGPTPTEDELLASALAGDRRSLGRLISAAEEPERAVRITRALRRAGGPTGHVVGVTGPAGVGKSSTVAAMVSAVRGAGDEVAVLAVDPSSPFSGGALLGDRIRMRRHTGDHGTYIRSMANRGDAGGLSRAVPVAVRLLEAVGFGTVIVETVGTGQAEIDVLHAVDTVVLVSAPGAGDEVQAAKAGLLEIADVYVVNKADVEGSNALVRSLRRIASLADDVGSTTDDERWRRPVVRTVARDEDVADLVRAVEDHRRHLAQQGRGACRRRRQHLVLVELAMRRALVDVALSAIGRDAWAQAVDRVVRGELDEAEAARGLLGGVGSDM